MVKCRDCLFHTASAHIRHQNGHLEEQDVCGINDSPVDLEKEKKCVTFVPFPDKDARKELK